MELIIGIIFGAILAGNSNYDQCYSIAFEGPQCQTEKSQYKQDKEYLYCLEKDFKDRHCATAKKVAGK
jgi:hypothetical protein